MSSKIIESYSNYLQAIADSKTKQPTNMSPSSTITDIIENFIHSPEVVKLLVENLSRPTKVELTNVVNHLTINTVNIPNPDCVGGIFGHAICITTTPEWNSAEIIRINGDREVAAQETRRIDNAAALAANDPADNSPITYTEATVADCEPFPALVNPGKYIVNSNWTAKDATINKLKHDVLQKEYTAQLNVDAAIQLFFRKVFPADIFADMMKSTNFVLNKTTALEMRHHLETKFNKTLPGHIEDVMVTFNKPPDPNEPIGTYFAKQNKCISLLENSDEPIILAKQKRTLLGHMQKIPAYQQAVADYNKEVKLNGAKTWDETRLFFVAEDLNITDNLSALSNAGIGSAHIAFETQQNARIDQLQAAYQTLYTKNENYDIAFTEMANAINQTKENTPPPSVSSPPPTELQTILAAITNIQSQSAPAAKPKTDMEKILALLTTNAGNNGGRNNDTTRKPPRIGKPNLRYKFYCWSHGINPSHNSCGCTYKKPGHQTAALYEN